MLFERFIYGFVLLGLNSLVDSNTLTNKDTFPNDQDRNKNGNIFSGDDMWITVDADSASRILASRTLALKEGTLSEGNQTLFHVDSSMLLKVSQRIHDTTNGCGGLVLHRSFQEGKNYLERMKLGDQSIFRNPGINNVNVAKKLMSMVNDKRIKGFNHMFVNTFSNRYATSSEGIQASQWLMYQWRDIIYSNPNIIIPIIQPYGHSSIPQHSIIVTIPGTEFGPESVVIGAHLDSTSGNVLNSGIAPGADDDGSGIAVLTEVLTLLIETGFRPAKTIHIMAFAGEELGLLGSRDIASDFKRNGVKVLGMLNLDMVGYQGVGPDIYISTDTSNYALASFLSDLLDHYIPGLPHEFMQCNGCSDHASWYENNFPATMATEAKSRNHPSMNPNYHSENDLSVNAEKMGNFARLTLTFLAEIAKGRL